MFSVGVQMAKKFTYITTICSLNSIINSLIKHKEKFVNGMDFSSTNRLVFNLIDRPTINSLVGPCSVREIEMKDSIQLTCSGFENNSVKYVATQLKELNNRMCSLILGQPGANLTDIIIANNEIKILLTKNSGSLIRNNKTENKRILLVDGSNLLCKGFFATSLSGKITQNKEGIYTNGVMAFTASLFRLIELYKTNYVIVAWDERTNFRKEIYPEYKTRDDKPAELLEQFQTARKLLSEMNISQVSSPIYEADDLIATIANQAVENDFTCYVASSDKDLFQILKPGIFQVFKKDKDYCYSDKDFTEEYGIEPKQWIDAKAILGDKSDTIKGVIGVGEKAVFPLLSTYRNLEGIYEHLEEMKSGTFKRYVTKFEEQRENAFFSRRLVTLSVAEDIDIELEHNKLTINKAGLINAFIYLEFTKLLDSVEKGKYSYL